MAESYCTLAEVGSNPTPVWQLHAGLTSAKGEFYVRCFTGWYIWRAGKGLSVSSPTNAAAEAVCPVLSADRSIKVASKARACFSPAPA